jgi:nucleoid-associated protein YgaU
MLTTRTYRIVGGVAVACAAFATGAPTAVADTPQPWTVSSPTPPTPSPVGGADPWQAAAARSSAAAWTVTNLRTAVARSAAAGAAAGAARSSGRSATVREAVHRGAIAQRKATKRATYQRLARTHRTLQQAAPATHWPARTLRSTAEQPHRIGTWTVHEGQSLSLIAALNSTTVHRIVRANADRYPSLRANPDHIETGWSLHIPAAQR